jgi:hypothetical protein
MNTWRVVALAPILAFFALGQCGNAAETPEDRITKVSQNEDGNGGSLGADVVEGLWSGTWGGGGTNGVVFQPVVAEIFIEGNHVELYGFPKMGRGRRTGTVRVDASAKQIEIMPAAKADGQPQRKVVYAYEIKDDELLLIDSYKILISLHRCRVAHDALANARVELVAATGINDAGDLLVTEFTSLRAGRVGATYLQPVNRSLKAKQAIVLVVQETGWKKITVDEARRLIHESTPVVVAYRHDDRPSQHQSHRLWTEMGSSSLDNEAVWRTFSRVFRSGTLVFILSARESVPQP